MGRAQPLFGRGGAWSDRADAVRHAAPSMIAFQVYPDVAVIHSELLCISAACDKIIVAGPTAAACMRHAVLCF
jgi:hypothetical protein